MHELKKEEKHPRKKIWIGRKKKIIEIPSAFHLFFVERESGTNSTLRIQCKKQRRSRQE